MAPRKPAGKAGRKPQDQQRGNRGAGKQPSGAARGGRGSRQEDQRPQREGRPAGRGQAAPRAGIRLGEDVSVLEGRHALEEALETGADIDVVWVSAALAGDEQVSRLAGRARSRGARIHFVDPAELDLVSSHGAHQGVAAQLKPYRYASLADLVRAAEGKDNALIVATDHVTDAGNFGAIVRSVEVVGGMGVLIPNKRNARVNTAAYKTSAGAVLHLPIAMESNLARSLAALKEEGFWIVGASEHASDLVWDAPLAGRVVLVMGSEGSGLSRLTLEACDMLVKLPQAGKVESLNVAQATTAIAYEWARQCRAAHRA
ncbi:MAG: 23S rRNA (guanosine(2251)-2'-O)-methyltransferase RlmB [Coriobacteriales bacterium]